MLTIVHLLVGATIGKYLSNIWVIILLAIASHYLLDLIPHKSFKTIKNYKEKGLKKCNKKELFLKSLDSILGIILVISSMFIFKEKAIQIFLGGFFAWLPDLFQFISWKYNLKFLEKIIPMPNNKLYNQIKNKKINIIIQSTIGIMFLIFLFLKTSSKETTSIIILASAIPLGLLSAFLTRHEKQIHKKYFPPILWILAITSAIFYTLNLQVALTTTFMFLLILTWHLK